MVRAVSSVKKIMWGYDTAEQKKIPSHFLRQSIYTTKQHVATWRGHSSGHPALRSSAHVSLLFTKNEQRSQGCCPVSRYRTRDRPMRHEGYRRRSTPHTSHIGLDLNDGLGLEKERRIKSDALSAGCCRDEGHARKLFREMMEQQKMVRSQWTLPTSRYLPRPARRTDFDRLHLAPSVLRWLNHQGRAFHSGRTLQHGAVRRSLDHDPVLVRFAFAPDVFRPPQPEMVRLDMDLLDEDGLSKGGIHGKSRSRRKRGRSR